MGKAEGFYDAHCHILPGVDDGAKNAEAAREMLKIAYDEGIRTIIVTPHYHYRHYTVTGEELSAGFRELQAIAGQVDKSLKVYLGNELYYCSEAGELLHDGVVRTMAGSDYVLTEFNPIRDYAYIKNALYDIQMEGYNPILAHIERYECMNKRVDRVEQLLEMGVILQVNASSIMGGMGYSMKQYLRKLLKYEYIQLIGTDAHGTDHRRPEIRKCAEFIQKKCSDGYARRLLFENPEKIIMNEYI